MVNHSESGSFPEEEHGAVGSSWMVDSTTVANGGEKTSPPIGPTQVLLVKPTCFDDQSPKLPHFEGVFGNHPKNRASGMV